MWLLSPDVVAFLNLHLSTYPPYFTMASSNQAGGTTNQTGTTTSSGSRPQPPIKPRKSKWLQDDGKSALLSCSLKSFHLRQVCLVCHVFPSVLSLSSITRHDGGGTRYWAHMLASSMVFHVLMKFLENKTTNKIATCARPQFLSLFSCHFSHPWHHIP